MSSQARKELIFHKHLVTRANQKNAKIVFKCTYFSSTSSLKVSMSSSDQLSPLGTTPPSLALIRLFFTNLNFSVNFCKDITSASSVLP